MKAKILPPFLAILTGILFSTSYIPNLPWAMFFAMVPLWYCWTKTNNLKAILGLAFLSEFVALCIMMSWLPQSISEFAEAALLPSYLIAFIAIIISSNFFLFSGLIFWLLEKFFNKGNSLVLTILALPVAHGLAYNFSINIFPWNPGYTWLYAKLPAFQFADIIGFEGLGILTYFYNALILFLFLSKDSNKEKIFKFGIAVGSFALINLAGWMYKSTITPSENHLSVMLIQPNISNQRKHDSTRKLLVKVRMIDDQIGHTLEALKESTKKPDLVLWPETAFPDLLDSDFAENSFPFALRRFVKEQGIHLITGGYSNTGNQKDQNSIALLGPSPSFREQLYSKSILLPFAEYIPAPAVLGWLRKYMENLPNYTVKDNQEQMNFNGIKLGTMICYESVFPWFSRKLADEGTQIFLNFTNDAWFGTNKEPFQHFYTGIGRAIEFRRPFVRVTNSGISGVVDKRGNILAISPIGKEWDRMVEVPFDIELKATVYQKFGHYISYILVFFFLIFHWRLKI